jgi:hypothetical protein
MKYTVTIQITDQNTFLKFLDLIGPTVENVIVSVLKEEARGMLATETLMPAPPFSQRARKVATRKTSYRRRGSRVNDTVVKALGEGASTVKHLKQALEAQGLAPGSLSTSLAALAKQGTVERVGEGLYALTAMKAAHEAPEASEAPPEAAE